MTEKIFKVPQSLWSLKPRVLPGGGYTVNLTLKLPKNDVMAHSAVWRPIAVWDHEISMVHEIMAFGLKLIIQKH